MLNSVFLNRDGEFEHRHFDTTDYKKTKKRVTALNSSYWGIVGYNKTFAIEDFDKPKPIMDMYDKFTIAGFAVVSETLDAETMQSMLIPEVQQLLQAEIDLTVTALHQFQSAIG